MRYARFIPQDRIRRIRWEESVARSQARRRGLKPAEITIKHWNCTCGSVECLGNVLVLPMEAQTSP